MDPTTSLITGLSSLGGMGLLAAVLFYLLTQQRKETATDRATYRQDSEADRKTFREEAGAMRALFAAENAAQRALFEKQLQGEREQCQKNHERMFQQMAEAYGSKKP